ncbi:MAG: glutamate 5-kinase [Dehalococcoidia bacterium]
MSASGTAFAGRRIVAKFGSNLLTGGGGELDAEVMSDLVRQVAELVRAGAQVAIVTSGAIVAGRNRLGAASKQANIEQRQVLAAIGQSHLVERYDTLLREHGLIAAQALLTRADLADRAGYLNARNTLEGLLAAGVVPVINENDVVADEELRGGAWGENDRLSALVANLLDADLLVLLSDVAGLYDRDPREHPEATLLPEVSDFDRALGFAGLPGDRGRGGMRAKLEAARLASGSGTTVVIAAGQAPDALLRVARGEALGTRFPARASRLESRKRWLLSGLAPAGGIVVDDGAAGAVRRNGRSLLAAGIVEVEGTFSRGDIVEVRDRSGGRVAVGISNYNAADIERIQGERSDRIAGILGYEYGDEVIHRNNLALP